MKVVLFCGGQGMRMRDFSERVPKPLVPVGPRPILWHMMKYYAHFGHDDFVLCLGYGDRQIKEYFLEYKEWLSNDFVMTKGGPLGSTISMSMYTYKQFGFGNYGYAAALSYLIFVVIAVVTAIQFRFLRENQ